RGLLKIATADQIRDLNENEIDSAPSPEVEEWSTDKLRDEIAILRSDFEGRAWYEKDCWDIEVGALHQSYLRKLRKNCHLMCDTRVEHLKQQPGGWKLNTNRGDFHAGLIINAAGAWAGQISEYAGATEIGLVPKRRTIVVVPAPESIAAIKLPMIVDRDEEFYLKPEAGRLLLSPADETPTEPGDAQPEEMDVAICIDRIERVFDLEIRRIENQWAGLRCFAVDGNPVCGFDPAAPDFFWLAALGGYGIQIIPELSRLAAGMVSSNDRRNSMLTQGSVLQSLSPDRFAV
ncbi:MAG: NAD(P)/FAD-dependent oxidoreductase, partial [Methyloligellaceae bacterium]